MKKTYLYMIELIRATIYNRKPAQKPDDVSWESLYGLSKEHMVVSLTWNSVTKIPHEMNEDMERLWREEADKALVKEISFDAERGTILAAFEKNQIPYMPLKGIILKDYYDRPGLRQFSDNDILYDKKRQMDVKDIMEGLGYTSMGLETHHDAYEKEPIFNFEMHKQLLPAENDFAHYFEKIWERGKKDADNSYGYHMSKEDFYLFNTVHLKKHFGGSGTGLRYFVDQHYLDTKLKTADDFDREINKRNLEMLGLTEFEQTVSALGKVLFGESQVVWEEIFENQPNELLEQFQFVMTCGAYGRFENLIQNRMKIQGNKWRYFLSRLKCADCYMLNDYPILKKAHWLMPVFRVVRLVRAPFQKTEKVKAEFKALIEKKKKA